MRIYPCLILILILEACVTIRHGSVRDIGNDFDLKLNENSPINTYIQKSTQEKLDGKVKFSAGIGTSIGDFQDGILNGELFVYEGRKLIQQTKYSKGVKHGTETKYAKKNRTISNFEQGLKNGEETEFKKGKLYRKVQFKNGLKTGTESYVDTKGKSTNRVTYKLDTDASYINFDAPLSNEEYSMAFTFGGKLTVNSYSETKRLDNKGYENAPYFNRIEELNPISPNDVFYQKYFLVDFSYNSSFDTSDGGLYIAYPVKLLDSGKIEMRYIPYVPKE